MCYDGDKFIGLNALLPLSTILIRDYKLIIIFDASIRSMLNKNDKKIKEQFNDNIIINIVATGQKADETILDLASDNLKDYVISNDRFVDYFDKEVVKNKRIFRHEIVNRQVLIHDLDINIKYNAHESRAYSRTE